jgi:hypothetical protein
MRHHDSCKDCVTDSDSDLNPELIESWGLNTDFQFGVGSRKAKSESSSQKKEKMSFY